MPDAILVLITTATVDDAKKLAQGLVEARHAACVNILPAMQSVYQWQGKVETQTEYLLLCKTRPSHFQTLANWVKAHHAYDIPEIIEIPITNGFVPYLDWIAQSITDPL